MGGDPSHRQDSGGIPPQGGPPSDDEEIQEAKLWHLAVPPLGKAMGDMVL